MPYLLSKPIVIVPYDPQWPVQYEAERQRIGPIVEPVAVQIEHIGSTSVPGLAGKDIVDISVSVRNLEDSDATVAALRELGYEDAQINPIFQRRMFAHGPWNEAGSVHLHFTVHGSDTWVEPILLRDYLRVHPAERDWYAEVKRENAAAHGNDLDGYQEGKGDCILTLMERARAWKATA